MGSPQLRRGPCDHRQTLDRMIARVFDWHRRIGQLEELGDCPPCAAACREAADLFRSEASRARRERASGPRHYPGLCCAEQTRYAYLCDEMNAGRRALKDAARAFEGAGDQIRAAVYRAAWRVVAA